MIRVAVVSLFLAVPALAEDKPLTPEEAAKQVGKVVTVEMKAATSGVSLSTEGITISMSSKGFSEKTGQFMIEVHQGDVKPDKFDELKEMAKRFEGKTVRAKGKVELLRGETTGWTLRVKNPADIKIIEKK